MGQTRRVRFGQLVVVFAGLSAAPPVYFALGGGQGAFAAGLVAIAGFAVAFPGDGGREQHETEGWTLRPWRRLREREAELTTIKSRVRQLEGTLLKLVDDLDERGHGRNHA
jgi:hypothetical protein